MSQQTLADAYSVLFPAFDGLSLDDGVRRHLSEGGRAILIGESRAEYVARRMSAERVATETAEDFRRLSAEAQSIAGPTLIAIDQEPGGIERLEGLAPRLPTAARMAAMTDAEIENAVASSAAFARSVGVNIFLAPILDLAAGRNPWLDGRRLSSDPHEVARFSAAFIRGAQSADVSATAKHFPGYRQIALDPAVDAAAQLSDTPESFEPGFVAFQAAIANNVDIVMLGPAIVEAFDAENPPSTSPRHVALLRQRFGFGGLIMSDDLDAAAITRCMSVPEFAVKAMVAGADLLLLSAGPQVDEAARALHRAVATGALARERLAEAAERVRRLAGRRG
jgi:beta-N-acetylhexosaminidase